MTKIATYLLACLIAVAFLAAPMTAWALRGNVQSNAGYCKSGVHVMNMKKCKENGGKK